MKNRLFKSGLIVMLSVLLASCSLPGLGSGADGTIRISTLTNTETQVLGHMLRHLIEEETNLKVEMVENLGTSIIQHQALTDGQVDITAARYTGTDMASILDVEPMKDPDKAMAFVQKEFDERFDQIWYDSYGFQNTYAFTVTEALAEQEGLETVSDLEKVADSLTLGVDNNWLNRQGDGYPGFVEAYGFEFGEALPMSIGLVYQAVQSGKMDVVLAYSTDGRLKAFNLKTLEDDQRFFPPYETSPVTRKDVIEKHPELDELLRRVAGKIDAETMMLMNYEADVNKKEPAIVAKEFLEEHNYFRDKGE
ncbi:osmoprotectant ABC transporter substrate-binding protein [Bhargavaea beijingensis]|uniref:Osmoprotectant ABC transporter substrate-binding protein n=1 Tax=Bhargavaea beijingensis TaxID=426756 RepID=A0A1G6YN44_9BACL|nr:osmoprotectant ABC transporter substrate-binding protein [Bhargavaea beijingensis]MCW1928617.1 osmoprotectant ABC transporter substrate-binding protein [Bhargavaea beijingensis]RSK36680.1 osmoprotectant ABC transporter substrate-binding protein [Bhargavaea beijingensis]SDD91731.1 osmoprotectant transport system substrate-binding protein [Bhargavaea beijingensis]